MKRFLSLCALLSVWLSFALAQPALANSTQVQPLLAELTEKSLTKAIPVLEQLEATGSDRVLPVFQAMLGGDLYYIKTDRQVIAVNEQNGETRFVRMLDGEPLPALKKSAIKKIRVNNRLRSHLRGAIARLQLSSKSAAVRENAVRSLLSDLDADTVAMISERRLTEANNQVKEVMDLALAIHKLSNAPEAVDKLNAIQTLDGSLENDVRILLNRYATMSPEHSDYHKSVSAAAAKALVSIEDKIEFYAFIDQLFFGLSLGSVLLLAAIGLAITFGVMGVINMAHGEMIMLGAYTTYVVQLMMPNHIEYSLWVAIPAAFVVSGLMGIAIERGVIRHLHGRPLETLLATFGISLILQQLVRTIFSPLNRQVASPEWMSGSLEINPVLSLTLNRLYILAFALIVFFLLQMILKKTNLGLNVRAVSQNRDMARAMGVRSARVDALTFGLGSGIAGIAGVALSQLTNVGPNLGQAYIIDSFMVVVFGGVGNLLGTLVAAFSLGIANKFLEPVTGAVLASILVLVFIILFIQKRPKGLFPQKGRAAE